MVKNLPANARDIRDAGSISVLTRDTVLIAIPLGSI